MGDVNKNSDQRGQSNPASAKLVVPWYVHAYVWTFMIAFGLSPVLSVLVTPEGMQPGDILDVLAAVLLIQSFIWMAQRRCSSQDLSYWDGLLIVAASMRTGIGPISLVLSFPVLLFTVGASFVFALSHDARDPLHHAVIRYGNLIVAIHRRRLCR